MKKSVGLIVLYLFVALHTIHGDPTESIRNSVDFQATIEGLTANPQSISLDKLYIVGGTIVSFEVSGTADAGFVAQAEFMSARWNSTVEIVSNSIILEFRGKTWADKFPSPPSRRPTEKQIGNNTVGFAMLKYTGKTLVRGTKSLLIFEVIDYRKQ